MATTLNTNSKIQKKYREPEVNNCCEVGTKQPPKNNYTFLWIFHGPHEMCIYLSTSLGRVYGLEMRGLIIMTLFW